MGISIADPPKSATDPDCQLKFKIAGKKPVTDLWVWHHQLTWFISLRHRERNRITEMIWRTIWIRRIPWHLEDIIPGCQEQKIPPENHMIQVGPSSGSREGGTLTRGGGGGRWRIVIRSVQVKQPLTSAARIRIVSQWYVIAKDFVITVNSVRQ